MHFYVLHLQTSKKDKKKDILSDIRRTGSLLLLQFPTIVAVMMLNFCVRYGNRCVHHAIATRSFKCHQTLKTEQ